MQSKVKTKVLTIIGLIILSGVFFIHSDFAFAYSASISTNSSITIDAASAGDGTSIHEESINVTSDCRGGYNLTIATPNGSNLYAGGDSTGPAAFTAVDGTSVLGSSNNANKWGYTLTNNPTSNTVFLPLSTTASILKTPSQTASNSDINDTFSIYYGVKVDNSVTAGTYQMANNGAVVYYLTMDGSCTQYVVHFNANGGTGSMPDQGINVGEATRLSPADSLTAPVGASYTDAGNNTITGDADKYWTFWGWNTEIDGSGDWYKDMEEVYDLGSVGDNFTFYAQWKQATLADLIPGTPVGTEKYIDHDTMQDISPATCLNSTAYSTDTNSPANLPYDASTNPNGYHTITLLDYRGKVTTGANPESPEQYTVSKLPDGLCWMTKDLNLGRSGNDGPNGDGTITLTPYDTDIASNFTLPASPTTYTSSTQGYYTPQILTNHTINSYTVNNISYSPTTSYYSWAAATATNTSITSYSNIDTSICPRNWDLPTTNQFPNLKTKGSITSAAIAHAEPYNFIYGGYRNAEDGYYEQTSYGYYWTSTSSSSSRGYLHYLYSSGLYGSDVTNYKYYGAKVRCVASQGKATIYYDGNGNVEYPVTGSTASQENVDINSIKTRNNGFTRDGWYFNGWNTAADGSGISIAAASSISVLGLKPGDTITLYAQWLPQYTVTYINNCMTYASSNDYCIQSESDLTGSLKINLDANGNGSGTLAAYDRWDLPGWKIKEWTTNADGSGTAYPVSSTYTVTGSNAGDGITLYAHWVPIYTIQYDGNGADNPNGMGTTNSSTGQKGVRHTYVSEGDTFDLFASNFKRTGYGFAGWSTDASAWEHFTDADTTNDPIIYGPNATMAAPTYPTNGTNIVTLYAVWVPAETNGGNPVYFQDWNGCSNLTPASYDSTTGSISAVGNSVTALTDKRDNEVYAIARLTEGRCWMIENLRLSSSGTVGNNVNDSSVTNQSLAQGYGGVFVGLADPENSFPASTKANSLYSTTNITGDNLAYRFPRYNESNKTWNNNSSSAKTPSLVQKVTTADAHLNFDNYVYSYGNYYSWAAAVANTDDLSSNRRVGTSICPAGWDLPFYGISTHLGGSFGYLRESMDIGTYGDYRLKSIKIRSFPNNFLLSGDWGSSSNPSYRGEDGNYWTSTTDRVYSGLFALIGDASFNMMTGYSKNEGFSIRCNTGCALGNVCYDKNSDDAEGTMESQAVSSSEESPILHASNFSRSGYGFAGWNTKADGTGTDYGPNESITDGTILNEIQSSGLTLYAKWVPSVGNIQGWSCPNNSTMPIGSVTALTDQRDSQTYAIAKLADGKCWMIENLKLGNANSDNGTGALAQGYGTSSLYGDFSGLADAEKNNFTSVSTANSLYYSGSQSGTASIDIGTTGYPESRFPRYDNVNTASRANFATDSDNVFSYGNYYTWAAAIADTAPHSTNNESVTATSICPTGWHLPIGGSSANSANSEIWQLGLAIMGFAPANNSSYSYSETNNNGKNASQALRSYPNNYTFAGLKSGTSAMYRGYEGIYWTSTAYDSSFAYYEYFSDSTVTLDGHNNYKYYGKTIRCVAD